MIRRDGESAGRSRSSGPSCPTNSSSTCGCAICRSRLAGSVMQGRIARAAGRARHPRAQAADSLLAVGRMVHARRRAGDRDPVLPGASASRPARARPDVEVEGGARVAPADPAPRGRPRVENAYGLRRRGGGRTFGARRCRIPSSTRRSRTGGASCNHLESWYAQSHPDEDFAETFAVWLTPGVEVAASATGLAGAQEARVRGRAHGRAARPQPLVDAASEVDPLRAMRKTLRKHYDESAALRRHQAGVLRRRLPPAVLGCARPRRAQRGGNSSVACGARTGTWSRPRRASASTGSTRSSATSPRSPSSACAWRSPRTGEARVHRPAHRADPERAQQRAARGGAG